MLYYYVREGEIEERQLTHSKKKDGPLSGVALFVVPQYFISKRRTSPGWMPSE
jgi:hypothetical protein